jgi:hypothetical protein
VTDLADLAEIFDPVVSVAPPEHWRNDPEQFARIKTEIQGEYGGRRYQIVFIGQNLERERTRDILD